jgi:hypothetical protein
MGVSLCDAGLVAFLLGWNHHGGWAIANGGRAAQSAGRRTPPMRGEEGRPHEHHSVPCVSDAGFACVCDPSPGSLAYCDYRPLAPCGRLAGLSGRVRPVASSQQTFRRPECAIRSLEKDPGRGIAEHSYQHGSAEHNRVDRSASGLWG